MFSDLRNKRALVTGASSGLGEHFAGLLARRGVAVTLAARREDRLAELRDKLEAGGAEVETLVLDVSDSAAVAAALAGRGFDIVVNNAGVSLARSALDHQEGDFERVIGTNLNGLFNVARHVAATMHQENRPGAIVNIASILGHRVAGQLAAYAASKAGVVQLTRALALEWARYGIRVNALSPGYIETPLNRAFFGTEAGKALVKRIPQRRLGQPEDLDGAFLLLCSDAGRYITGSSIVVDGGHLVSSL